MAIKKIVDLVKNKKAHMLFDQADYFLLLQLNRRQYQGLVNYSKNQHTQESNFDLNC